MILRRIHASLLLRTTLTVLGAALGVGLAALALAGRVADRWELGHQREAMEAQLDGVASLASGACFVEDRALSQQIVSQLVATRNVQAATLRTPAAVLAQAERPGAVHGRQAVPLVRAIPSPFFQEVQLGELVLVPDLGEAERLAARTASLLRMVVFCLTAALGLTLAFVVRRTIILPIAALSHRLHLLAPETGALLTGIRSHERDELGQLVRDVNALLERLMEALRQERLQGEQRALEHMKTQSLIQNAGTGMFLVNAEATLEAWTPAFLRMLEREQPLPVRGAELLPLFGDSGALVRDCLARCRFGARQVVEVFRVGNAGAEGHRWLQLCLDPMEKGWIQGLLEDVTALRDPTETAGARQLAVRDPLTGLLNRLGAEQAMADLFFRNRGGLALVMVDLDQFQAVNDSFGHEAGDAVLRQVAARLQASLRHTDLVARLGGDEFIAVLDNMTNESLLQDLARKLIAAINLPIALPGGGEVQVGCSLGLVLQEPGAVLSRTVLLKRADTAMYLAKQAGRNCARLFGAD